MCPIVLTGECLLAVPAQCCGSQDAAEAPDVSKRSVRFAFIENPQPGGKRYTTARCAKNYVERGLAQVTGPDRIRFLETNARQQEAVKRLSSRPDESYGAIQNWSGNRRPDRLYRPGEVCS